MPTPLTIEARFLAKLRELLRPRGAATRLADAIGRSTSWISMITTETRHADVNDMDAIARYFRLSLAEMTGVARPGELSGDEQRMVYAFRALPAQVKEHFLALITAASVTARAEHERESLRLTALERRIIQKVREQPATQRTKTEEAIAEIVGLPRLAMQQKKTS